MRGMFITFEGIDGAGKSTHVEAAAARIAAAGHEVVRSREPGGTPLGEAVRSLFLNQTMTPSAELLLVFAARREHLETLIWPALERGAWVLCDRFTDATMAYQGYGRALGAARVDALAAWTHPNFVPNLTLWFDVEPQLAAARLAASRAQSDRFEREQTTFFERVRAGYAAIAQAEPQRFKRIDSAAPLDRVAAAVNVEIDTLLV
jgi:dTMP kinase